MFQPPWAGGTLAVGAPLVPADSLAALLDGVLGAVLDAAAPCVPCCPPEDHASPAFDAADALCASAAEP
jgi:hypothetical protein